MRYLTLAADYLDPSLVDVLLGRLDVRESGVSEELGKRIFEWNKEYQVVIPCDLLEREALNDLIEDLDEKGAALARDVQRELAPAKVRYYSEGWLRYR